ncbi:hypothetical protein [Methanosarcina sp.]|uniref:hypothetical protein n=1 Tax=Methanosarcina sp. TaxID=2213 RepID=UPI002CF313E7|nr:hypothetical protein [Methanosarcina sp.]HOW13842.1 hypothetical protein [Methanosarcina sp.]
MKGDESIGKIKFFGAVLIIVILITLVLFASGCSQKAPENETKKIENETKNLTTTVENKTKNLTTTVENKTKNLTTTVENKTKNLTTTVENKTNY